MAKNNAGAIWLHWANNKTPNKRVWGKKERELKLLAEHWKDEGLPLEVILKRVVELRTKGDVA